MDFWNPPAIRLRRSLRAVRPARAGQVVGLLREAHELDFAAKHPQRTEQLLSLVDRAAQVHLAVGQEQWSPDALDEADRRATPHRARIRPVENAHLPVVPESDVAGSIVAHELSDR